MCINKTAKLQNWHYLQANTLQPINQTNRYQKVRIAFVHISHKGVKKHNFIFWSRRVWGAQKCHSCSDHYSKLLLRFFFILPHTATFLAYQQKVVKIKQQLNSKLLELVVLLMCAAQRPWRAGP